MAHMPTRGSTARYIRGVTLIDVLVGTAIMSMVFLALASSFQAASEFAVRNRLRANALLIANDHLETIRALPYDSIGTVSGLPWGNIPQVENIIYDGKQYTRRTFIQYVDDPADGTGVSDTLSADYKRIKTEISYIHQEETLSFSLVTSVAPKSQEALAGAGVLQLKVVNASNDPVSGATVHVFNDSIATTVDITTFSNASGNVSLPGAWAGDGYEITISNTGYSGAQTYGVSVANPAPSPAHANVLEGEVMELIFSIDVLSSLSVVTRLRPVHERFIDEFTDESQLSSTTSTEVLSGSLVLTGGPATYETTGTGISTSIAPVALGSWLLLSFTDTEPAGTEIRYHVQYNNGGSYERIPDAALSGNAAGFTTSPVDLGVLNPSVYPDLRVEAVLTSSDMTATPSLDTWTISYLNEAVVVPNVDFSLQGLKTIGTSPVVYKYDMAHSTDATGLWEDATLEWDEYTLTEEEAGYVVTEACPSLPVSLEPGVAYDQVLTLAGESVHALRLTVLDPFGAIVPRAEVRVTGGAIDTTQASGPCGIAYFSSLSNETYTVTIEAAGYAPFSTTLPVDGMTDSAVSLAF